MQPYLKWNTGLVTFYWISTIEKQWSSYKKFLISTLCYSAENKRVHERAVICKALPVLITSCVFVFPLLSYRCISEAWHHEVFYLTTAILSTKCSASPLTRMDHFIHISVSLNDIQRKSFFIACDPYEVPADFFQNLSSTDRLSGVSFPDTYILLTIHRHLLKKV